MKYYIFNVQGCDVPDTRNIFLGSSVPFKIEKGLMPRQDGRVSYNLEVAQRQWSDEDDPHCIYIEGNYTLEEVENIRIDYQILENEYFENKTNKNEDKPLTLTPLTHDRITLRHEQ